MGRTVAYILIMLVAIALGIYFYHCYCSECNGAMKESKVTSKQVAADNFLTCICRLEFEKPTHLKGLVASNSLSNYVARKHSI